MELSASIHNRSAVVGVVGLGYVGLPLLSVFHRAGFSVIGFDTDPRKIAALSAGENYLKHLGESLVSDMRNAGRFSATDDMSLLAEGGCDSHLCADPFGETLGTQSELCREDSRRGGAIAPTRPVDRAGIDHLPRHHPPDVLPRLEKTGLKLGSDFLLAYSPEREDPGRKDFNTQTIPKLVGGIDAVSGRVAVALYQAAIQQVIPVSSAEVAEAAKILENVYRSVNIALVNEMKLLLSAMNIDVWEVIAAAATKPFGYQPFYPGRDWAGTAFRSTLTI